MPGTYQDLLFRKPLHVPSANTSNVFHDQLESGEVNGRDCVKSDVEEDKRPLEEGIGCVG